MKAFVLDCSLTMAWCFEDEQTEQSQALLERLAHDEAVAPSLWALEVTNVLLVAERRGRLTAARAEGFAAVLKRLPITVSDASPSGTFDRVLPLARSLGLSAYDASYVELALSLGLPLASLDRRLIEAANRLGVVTLP